MSDALQNVRVPKQTEVSQALKIMDTGYLVPHIDPTTPTPFSYADFDPALENLRATFGPRFELGLGPLLESIIVPHFADVIGLEDHDVQRLFGPEIAGSNSETRMPMISSWCCLKSAPHFLASSQDSTAPSDVSSGVTVTASTPNFSNAAKIWLRPSCTRLFSSISTMTMSAVGWVRAHVPARSRPTSATRTCGAGSTSSGPSRPDRGAHPRSRRGHSSDPGKQLYRLLDMHAVLSVWGHLSLAGAQDRVEMRSL